MSVVTANFELADQLEALASDLAQALEQDTSAHDERLARLHAALTAASTLAREAGLRGVPELLRQLQSGLSQMQAARRRAADHERESLALWLLQLGSYCAGQMESGEYAKLLDTLASVPWVPEIAPRMRELILTRLMESAPVSSLHEAQEPEPEPEPMLKVEEADLSHSSTSPLLVELAVSATDEELIAESALDLDAVPASPALSEQPAVLQPPGASSAIQNQFTEDLDFLPESDTAFEAAPRTHDGGGVVLPEVEPDTDLGATIAIDDETIWISAEEFALAGSAIATQLIPLTQEFAEAEDEARRVGLIAELEFQTGLVGGAFEVLGLSQLWQLTARVQALLQSATAGNAAPLPDVLAAWQVAMLGFLDSPDSAAVKLLCQMAAELVGEFDQAALITELARVRLGIDPKRIATRKREGTLEDVVLDIAPDVLPSVLDGMLRELPGNALRLGEGLRHLVAGGASEDLAEARRFAHTLKGDANTVGVRGLANLAHALEDILLELANRSITPEGELAAVLTEAADAIETIADYLLQRGPAPDDLLLTYQRVLDAANTLLIEQTVATVTSPAAEAVHAPPRDEPATKPAPLQAGGGAAAVAPPAAPARAIEASHSVAIALLNELLRLAGESIVLMRQIEQRVKGVSGVYHDLVEQNRVNRDLVAQLDDLVALRGAALQSARLAEARDVDHLELDQYTELHVVSRRLIESNSDQIAFMQRMDGDLLTLDDLLSMQERTQSDLQRLVLRTRTIPLSNVVGRLQRLVRQVSRQLLKPVELEIEGAETEVDSELLDRIVEPLSHILRNAVDHGIETPEDRRLAGKPEQGHIRLSLVVQGDAIEILIVDDGRGLDLEAIRQRAVEKGVFTPEHESSEAELARLVMLPGFSTKTETTQVSGRGIGMDVVAQRVSDLRGGIALHSNPGKGLEIRIRLPASLTSANVILARDGSERIAAVASSVARIVALEAKDFHVGADGRLYAETGEETFPAIPLSALFDAGSQGWGIPELRRTGLIVDAVGMDPYVIYTERVDEVRNVVVKNIGATLAPIPALRGVTILGDGGIAPVLDLAQSVQEMARLGGGSRMAVDLNAAAVVVPRIVVADDSLSVRRALGQLMQDAGYSVVTARDGIEALDSIREARPVAALLDLEMPRLNGLDVTRYLRNHAETAHLPVIMITSRATDKYRAMAEEAGVTQLVGKPFDEDELVQLIRDLIAAATGVSSV